MTVGDPRGIGPEIVDATLAALAAQGRPVRLTWKRVHSLAIAGQS